MQSWAVQCPQLRTKPFFFLVQRKNANSANLPQKTKENASERKDCSFSNCKASDDSDSLLVRITVSHYQIDLPFQLYKLQGYLCSIYRISSRTNIDEVRKRPVRNFFFLV